MRLIKQCKTCEFNADGVCVGRGDTYKYGETITDDNNSCEDWGANLEYYTEITLNAPRFLKEQLDDYRIEYSEFLSLLEAYQNGEAIPIDIFDAVKFVYGISMVDIAVLLDVTFGVVYRAKTKGIPAKRIKQFSDLLCIPPGWLNEITTRDLYKLKEFRDTFFNKSNIEDMINLNSASNRQKRSLLL